MDTSPGMHAGGTSEWHRLCPQAVLYVGNDFLPYKGWLHLKSISEILPQSRLAV